MNLSTISQQTIHDMFPVIAAVCSVVMKLEQLVTSTRSSVSLKNYIIGIINLRGAIVVRCVLEIGR